MKEQQAPQRPLAGFSLTKKLRFQLFLGSLVLVVILCSGYYGIRFFHATTLPVKTVQAVLGDIDQTVIATGKLQLLKYADVVAQTSGVINKVNIALGDDVKTGKLLLNLSLNSSETQFERNQAQLAQLRAELSEQQAQYEFNELQFKRQTQLKIDNATREDAFEASRTAMTTAAARLDAINARIRQAESNLKETEEVRKHTDVLAPISGTVVMFSAHPGQMVTAQQTSLARIADLSTLMVMTQVSETDVAHIHKDMGAYFSTTAYPDKLWFGKISQISPVAVENGNVNVNGLGQGQGQGTFYNVFFEVSNPDRLLMSGMGAKVNIVVDHVHDVVLVPVEALGKPEQSGLVTIQVLDSSQRVQQRLCRIGARQRDKVQIVSGLSAGEMVVVNNPTRANLADANVVLK